MKILMEALGFGLGDNLGGSVRVAAANARALAARGHKVTFWCTNRIDKTRKLFSGLHCAMKAGVQVVYLDTLTVPGWRGGFGPHYVRIPARIRETVSEHQVVHIHEFRSFLAGRLTRLAVKRHVPVVLQPQGTFFRHDVSHCVKWLYDHTWGGDLVTHAVSVIAATQSEAGALTDAGISRERITIVPNGLDVEAVGILPSPGEFRRQFRIPGDIPLIVSVGRLDEVKGFDLMLRALAKIPRPAMYVVVGPDHGYGSSLTALASELGLTDRFKITGALPLDRDVYAAIVDADVFVVPSRHEAFGQVILEACLGGRPMVLSSQCGVASDFADRAALMVPPEPSRLADACNRLLADPELRRRLGEEGRRMLESNYRLEAVAAKLEKIYLEVRSETIGEPRLQER